MLKRYPLVPWGALAAAALVLGACNNSNPNPLPTPGPTCNPGSVTTALVYPAPNSTAIPDNFGEIVVASSPNPLPSGWEAVAASTGYGNIPGGAFAPASPPFPTPNATPSFANPQYQVSSFSGAPAIAGQVVIVYLNNPNSTCTPLGPIGSFTTQ
jgi:hypothetical protein